VLLAAEVTGAVELTTKGVIIPDVSFAARTKGGGKAVAPEGASSNRAKEERASIVSPCGLGVLRPRA
jgi:hypothetical protein